MKRSTGPRSVVTLPLKVEPWQSDVMIKRFEMVRSIYNAMLGYRLKQYRKIISDPIYVEVKAVIDDVCKLPDKEKEEAKKTKEYKNATRIQKEKLKEYGFTEYDFGAEAIKYSKYFSQNISSKVAQMTVGASMWTAFEALFYRHGEEVHFKRRGAVRSVITDAKSGIRVVDADGNTVLHPEHSKGLFVCFSAMKGKALTMPINVPKNDYYKIEMLYRDIKQVRILYKEVKGKYHWYVQLVVTGEPALRYNKEGKLINEIHDGRIGVYIDTTSVTIAKGDNIFTVFDLHNGITSYQNRITELQRQMDASKRATNPDNFNEDGTIKKGNIVNGKREKLIWVYSNEYKRLRSAVSDLKRKEREIRKIERYKLANEILSYGSEVYVNDYSFKDAAKRKEFKKGEELTESGRAKKKKKAGAAIGLLAPAELIIMMNQKLQAAGYESVNKVEIKNIDKSEGYRKYYAKALLDGTI